MNSVMNQSVLTDLPNFYNEFEEKINNLINQLNTNGKKVSEKSKENINNFLNELKRKEQQLETLSLSLNSISLDKNFTNRIITMDDVMRYADNLKGHQLKGYDIVESLKKYVIDSEKKLEPLTTEPLTTESLSTKPSTTELNVESKSTTQEKEAQAKEKAQELARKQAEEEKAQELARKQAEEEKAQEAEEAIEQYILSFNQENEAPALETEGYTKDDVEATILATLDELNKAKELHDPEELKEILKGDKEGDKEGEEKGKPLKLIMDFNTINENNENDIDLNEVKKLEI